MLYSEHSDFYRHSKLPVASAGCVGHGGRRKGGKNVSAKGGAVVFAKPRVGERADSLLRDRKTLDLFKKEALL